MYVGNMDNVDICLCNVANVIYIYIYIYIYTKAMANVDLCLGNVANVNIYVQRPWLMLIYV